MRGKAIMSTVPTATLKTGFLDLDIFWSLSEIHQPIILDEPAIFWPAPFWKVLKKKLWKILEFELPWNLSPCIFRQAQKTVHEGGKASHVFPVVKAVHGGEILPVSTVVNLVVNYNNTDCVNASDFRTTLLLPLLQRKSNDEKEQEEKHSIKIVTKILRNF